MAKRVARQEIELGKTVFSRKTSHPGRKFIRVAHDSFDLQGYMSGKHVCMVMEPLRAPLGKVRSHGSKKPVPSQNIRAVLPSMLQALDYLHSEARLVHTGKLSLSSSWHSADRGSDLRSSHFMPPFEEIGVLQDYAEKHTNNPPRRKKTNHRPLYVSLNNFGPMRVPLTHVLLTDFGYAGYGDEPNNHDIQTDEFVAPEVTLRAYWSYPADIWNFGLMLFDMLGENLFNGIHTKGHFDARIRFGQMIRVLGPMPAELYDRAHKDFRSQFFNKQGMYTSKTKLPPANTLSGEFLHPRFIPDDSFNLENKASMLEPIERKLFINFVKRMLKWLPEERATAKELLDDPYLSYKSPLDIEFVKPEIVKPVYDGPRPSRHPHPLLQKKIVW